MSSCTTTVPNSVRKSDPVGQTSRHAACVQCLHTSLDINQRNSCPPGPSWTTPGSCVAIDLRCSMNATWRHVDAESRSVLSYDIAVNTSPSSCTLFHSLQATSHALHPMHTDVSVKKPMRGDVNSVVSCIVTDMVRP